MPRARPLKIGITCYPSVGGSGIMASELGEELAARGHDVVLRDVKPEFVERGMAVIKGVFDEAVARKKMKPEAAAAGLAGAAGGLAPCAALNAAATASAPTLRPAMPKALVRRRRGI